MNANFITNCYCFSLREVHSVKTKKLMNMYAKISLFYSLIILLNKADTSVNKNNELIDH